MGIEPEQLLEGSGLAYLAGARALTFATIGGEAIIYVASGTGGGLTALSVGADGTLGLLDQRAIAEPFAPGVVPALSVADGPDGPVLLISGLTGAGGGIWALDPDGSLGDPVGATGLPGALIVPVLGQHAGNHFLFFGAARRRDHVGTTFGVWRGRRPDEPS